MLARGTTLVSRVDRRSLGMRTSGLAAFNEFSWPKRATNPPRSALESDAFGPLQISADRLWGAQTQRSLHNFRIGSERMPIEIVRALGVIKRASAEVNRQLGSPRSQASQCDRGRGSGYRRRQARQSFSACVANRVRHPKQHERQRGDRQRRQSHARRNDRSKSPVHPNDHVNMSQSSNDSIPTAMHIPQQRCRLNGISSLPLARQSPRARRESFRRSSKSVALI